VLAKRNPDSFTLLILCGSRHYEHRMTTNCHNGEKIFTMETCPATMDKESSQWTLAT
jgi:hypothetical protein